jgi:glycopeptide antibiotics resistance protein
VPQDGRVADERSGRSHVGPWLCLLAYLVFVGALTLVQRPDTDSLIAWRDQLQAVLDLLPRQPEVTVVQAEQFANVVLFLPVGLLLRLAMPRPPAVALLALMCAASIGIEVVQYLVLPDRVPSLIDVLTNVGGAAIGLVLGEDADRAWRWLRRRRARGKQVRRAH